MGNGGSAPVHLTDTAGIPSPAGTTADPTQVETVVGGAVASSTNPVPTTGALYVDAGNSTTAIVAAGLTWTGDWYDAAATGVLSVSVSAVANAGAVGEMTIQFSQDATTIHGDAGAHPFLASGSIGVPQFVSVSARYYRVTVENTGASDFTALTVQTLAGGSRIAMPTGRVTQTITDTSDLLTTRAATDSALDEALGRQADRTPIHKFGRNPSVDAATYEDIWSGGGLYPFPVSALAVRIKAGGNAADAAAGTGAQSIRVEGLDENWAEATEDLVTAGGSVSSATTTTFIRLNRAYIVNVGTYGAAAAGSGVNAGDIAIETTAGTTLAVIPALLGQTFLAVYTIPAGKIGVVRTLQGTTESAKQADLYFFRRQNADDVTTPFTGSRVFHAFLGFTGTREYVPRIPINGGFAAKTDIWARGYGPIGGGAMAARFEIALVDA